MRIEGNKLRAVVLVAGQVHFTVWLTYRREPIECWCFGCGYEFTLQFESWTEGKELRVVVHVAGMSSFVGSLTEWNKLRVVIWVVSMS